ncbi:hypothetical protein FRC06_007271, partial [Ceratobasidium sp. 370]
MSDLPQVEQISTKEDQPGLPPASGPCTIVGAVKRAFSDMMLTSRPRSNLSHQIADKIPPSIDNHTKDGGAGLRGRRSTSVPVNLPEILPNAGPSTMLETVTQTFSWVVSTVTSLANSALITMTEDIPIGERQMDHIQARTFVWTGCHQRQEAFDHMEYTSGLLTRVFTQTFETHFDELMARAMDYDTLFCKVSGEVNDQAFAMSTLQFVQLWTSLQDADENQV